MNGRGKMRVVGVLSVLVAMLGAARVAVAADQAEGRPLYLRFTVLEAGDAAGPFEATVDIAVIHRSPWYPGWKIEAGTAALGEPSAWTDLSERLANKTDDVTIILLLKSDGQDMKGPARVRVDLARAPDAEEPLASTEVADPEGRLGLVMPERAVPDREVPARLRSIAQVASKHLEATRPYALAPEEVPKHFIAATRAIRFGGYSDPAVFRKEVQTVLNMGYNTMTDLSPEVADEMGVPYAAGAESRPPGADGEPVSEDVLRRHYGPRAEALRKAFGSTDRLRALAVSDEPNWDFPQTSDRLNADPKALDRFRQYLKDRGFQPENLGCESWDEVKLAPPPGPDPPVGQRRLWYETVQFAGQEQIRGYAAAVRVLREELGDQVLAFTNWNNPGIWFSSVKPWHAGDFTASHNWFDFSRAGGATCIWLGPGLSEHGSWHRSTFRSWSLALNLLRCAAKQGAGRFGAYIHHMSIPDERAFEVTLSIMAVAGHGGSGYNSWIWGPHYAFTECMWSEKFNHYEAAADANRLVGRSEHLMHGATPPPADVAVLWPYTSAMYDLNKRGYWTYNRDFFVEAEQVGFALSHNNIPADFVDETVIQHGGLDHYRLLYVVGPNIQRDTATAIADWVRGGGVLWTNARSALRDELDMPMDLLDEVLGVTDRRVDRDVADYSPKGGLRWLEERGTIRMDAAAGLGEESWKAYGARESFRVADGAEVLGWFEDNSPATVHHAFGRGRSLHFAAMPGLAYSRGATEAAWQPTIDYPPRIAQLITALADELGVKKPATTSLPYVEALVLRHDRGTAVTLLNWSAKPVKGLEVFVADVPEGAAVRSARLGKVDATRRDGGVAVTLSMPKVADVLLVEFPQ